MHIIRSSRLYVCYYRLWCTFMHIIRSSRLYMCYYRLWCAMLWLLVVGSQVQGSRLGVRDEGCFSTAVEKHSVASSWFFFSMHKQKINEVTHSRKVPVRHPPTSIFLVPMKDALRGRRFADDDEPKQRAWTVPTFRQIILRYRHEESHAKVCC